MKMNLSLKLRLGLFLFSKGDEFTKFGTDRINDAYKFSKQQYELISEFAEKMISEWKGSSFVKSDESLRVAALTAMSESALFEERVKIASNRIGCTDIEFAKSILDEFIQNGEEVLQIIKEYALPDEPSAMMISSIPDDFVQGEPATLDVRPYHEPTEEEKVELDELTGSGFSEHIFVLDSGTTPGHEYLREHEYTLSMVPNEDGIDRNFHGTHVEGTAAGTREISTCYKSKVSSIQVFDRRGSGLMSWLANALRKARELGATVINYSGGASGTRFIDPDVELELKLCDEAGIIVCIAAGNDGWRQGQDTANSPGRSRYASCIGAVDSQDQLTSFGSGGPSVDSAHYGKDVVSADFRGGLSTSSGTSMATPNDSDDAGVVNSFMVKNGFSRINGTTGWNEFKKIHADDLYSPGHDGPTGYGLLRVLKKLKELKPDDVTMLSYSRKPSGGLATMIALMFSLVFACGDCKNADAQEITEVIKTVEIKTTYFGDKVLAGPTQTVVSESKKKKPAAVFEYEAEKVVAFDGDHNRFELDAVAENLFVAPHPGKYLVFRYPLPEEARVVIETPKPDFDLSTIGPLASKLAENIKNVRTGSVGDPATRSKLASVYAKLAEDVDGMAFEDATAKVKSTVLAVWPTRDRNSQWFDWVNGFQRPLQAELKRVGFVDTETYQAALLEISKALASSGTSQLQTEAKQQWKRVCIGVDINGNCIFEDRLGPIK